MKLIPYHKPEKDFPRETGRFETEEDLIREIKNINNRQENSELEAYYAIGTKIKGFYRKNYGKNEMAKIAKSIDLSTTTVYKIVQFAEKYSREDVEEISQRAFQLSWHRLRDNLGLQREEVLKVYRASHNTAEFNRKIRQFKRNMKSDQEAEHDAKDKVKALEESDQFCPGVRNLPVQGSDEKLSETIKNLHMKITKLQSENEQKDRQLDSLRRMLLNRKVDWMARFPEIIRDLDDRTLMRLEFSLFEEIKRREIEENKEESVIHTIN